MCACCMGAHVWATACAAYTVGGSFSLRDVRGSSPVCVLSYEWLQQDMDNHLYVVSEHIFGSFPGPLSLNEYFGAVFKYPRQRWLCMILATPRLYLPYWLQYMLSLTALSFSMLSWIHKGPFCRWWCNFSRTYLQFQQPGIDFPPMVCDISYA